MYFGLQLLEHFEKMKIQLLSLPGLRNTME
jgi:hypothetical protein